MFDFLYFYLNIVKTFFGVNKQNNKTIIFFKLKNILYTIQINILFTIKDFHKKVSLAKATKI